MAIIRCSVRASTLLLFSLLVMSCKERAPSSDAPASSVAATPTTTPSGAAPAAGSGSSFDVVTTSGTEYKLAADKVFAFRTRKSVEVVMAANCSNVTCESLTKNSPSSFLADYSVLEQCPKAKVVVLDFVDAAVSAETGKGVTVKPGSYKADNKGFFVGLSFKDGEKDSERFGANGPMDDKGELLPVVKVTESTRDKLVGTVDMPKDANMNKVKIIASFTAEHCKAPAEKDLD
jgi:hypothetical protein